MNQETVRALSEKDLAQVILWAQDELRVREEKRKQDTIAQIKQLAASVGVPVTINIKRGRPSRKPKSSPKPRQKT